MIKRTKYPRTWHLPNSQSNSSDDVWLKDYKNFEGQEVVVTFKMDGECTSIYPDGHVHARSIDTDRHPSRTWVKKIAGTIAHEIPPNFRICGENLYAHHSIFYTDLPSYFLVFGIYNGNTCLSWQETEEWCQLLGLKTVPVLYRGIWDEKKVNELWTGKGYYPTYELNDNENFYPKFPDDFSPCEAEGYVVRLASSFKIENFSKCCAKWVRANHVKTNQHWLQKPTVPNMLSHNI